MEYIFSKHASEQILKRGIKESNVTETMSYPDEIIHENDKQLTYQKLFINQVVINTYMIRVLINANTNPSLI
jgi:hypothetical protein